MDMKGAEIIVDHLVREEVPYLVGVCGHGILGLLDAAYDRQDEITTVTTHDERAAGLMADAYYRTAGRPIATYTSCGPGSANIVMAVASAFYDSSAFMAITGNVPTTQFNRGPFQETGRKFQGDFNNVMDPYVKRSFQAFRPEMLPLIMRQGFHQMTTGRPGPVHVDVPLDVFVERADVEMADPDDWRSGISNRTAAATETVDRAVDLLLAAERPVIVAGNGLRLSGGQQALRQLAEHLQIPVITPPLAKGVIPEDHPLSLGPTGRNGTHSANAAARSADVLLALGTRFDDRATSAWKSGLTYEIPPTKLIHVDIDPTEIARNYPPTLAAVADAATFLWQLNDRVANEPAVEAHVTTRRQWVERCAEWKSQWQAYIAERQRDDSTPIQPDRVVAALQATVPEDAVLLTDVGEHHNWVLQQLTAPTDGMLLQAWGFAAMGFGVAGSLGSQLAAPGRPVATVCGDAGFLMHVNAVATAVEYGLPVTWLVWNNAAYGSIYGQQRGFFGRELATRFYQHGTGESHAPDTAAIGRAFGAEAATVEDPADLEDTISWALKLDRPTVVDIRVAVGVPQPATGSWDLPPLEGPNPDRPWWDGS